MDKLAMIKAMAELDGVKVELVMFDGEVLYVYKRDDIFDPIDDDALNLKARDKHHVEIKYNKGHYVIKKWVDSVNGYQKLITKELDQVKFMVIKCILITNNLWVGE